MNILSIQSHVAYGHVGNDAATFPLQRIGVEVWRVNTVQFSNHTGYAKWRGRVFDAKDIAEVVRGIEDCGVLGECDGVISGYLGSAEIGEAILDSVARVKRANPAAHYCCDPVIGDVGKGVFVRPGVADFLRDKALSVADVITPNQFELGQLSGRESASTADALRAIDALHAKGPRIVLVTSLHTQETPDGAIDMAVSDGKERLRIRTPRLEIAANGAGDAIAALFFAHWLRNGSVASALSAAASSIYGILRQTLEAGAREMLLVAAQEEFVQPSQVFEPERFGP
ncbi:MAG: pyridoxal kinase PdxY [Variibacter sp.]